MQRVPRYVLLLGEIAKRTDERDQCGVKCRQALESVKQLAALTDNTPQDLNNLARVADIQSLVNSPINLAEGSRQLVDEGWLFGQENDVEQFYYCFLFTDLLLLVRQKGLVCVLAYLKDLHVLDLSASQTEHVLELRGPELDITVTCSSGEAKNLWMDQIQTCQRKLRHR